VNRPADVLDHATSGIPLGGKPATEVTNKRHGEGCKRPWPPFIKRAAAVGA
jgi:3-polyprenyl-4-hydroxybenzoate decarboxylase